MDFLNPVFNIFSPVVDFFVSFNYELMFQLICLGLIVVSGPVVIFLLAAKSGDL